MSQNKNKCNRNKSFDRATSGGRGFSSPASPNRGRGGGRQRAFSNDGSLPVAAAGDDDGFTSVPTKKKVGGRFANENNRNSHNNSSFTPKGRANPTSSFTRPRPAHTRSFDKPRPTGSFNKKAGGRPKNLSASKSFDFSNHHDRGGRGGGRGRGNQRRTKSFEKPMHTGSFNAKNSRNHMSSSEGNHHHSFGAANADAQAKREQFHRSNSRLTSYDVELYTQGDGKSPAQRTVVRHPGTVLMRARLSHLEEPEFGEDGSRFNPDDTWGPHHKCHWTDPTRKEQIEQVMQQYPNAVPLHLKKRTRIKSSKLGDSTTLSAASSVVSEVTVDYSEQGDDMSVATSTLGADSVIFGATEDDTLEMNPLRKTLMLLNKLSWTTIDKLTPKLFEILEQDVPNLTPTLVPPTSIKTETTTTPDGDAAENANKPEQPQDQEEPSETSESESKKDKAPATKEEDLNPMVVTILTLIVEKAQTEPHFSAMYAQLCFNLAERNLQWRKKILGHCQKEFEKDIAWHTARLDERLEEQKAKGSGMEDLSSATNATEAELAMDREYQVLQIRKKYLGHCQFIGELFKLRLIKLDIMIWCLGRCLWHKEPHVDEDDLECFAKLMTVVGAAAEALVQQRRCHALAIDKWYDSWDRVYWLTGREITNKKKKRPAKQQPQEQQKESSAEPGPPPKISSRIKFMLVDLLELEENDWEHRRQLEKPKTIAEIHEEVREEEEETRRRIYSDDMSGSFGSVRRRMNSDDYNYGRSPGGRSPGGYNKSPGGGYKSPRSKPVKIVDVDGFIEIPSTNNNNNNNNSRKQSTPPAPPKKKYPDPQECKDKTKNILKEYFIAGDTDDAILSIDELVGAGKDKGSVERGAAVIESGVLLVMEMKQQEVQKFLAVVKRCLQKNKIEKESLPLGLNDPLEFLRDIEIDAPMAASLLISIVAYWVRQDALLFNFLLGAPEYFRTDGKPAEFAAGVLKVRGDNPSEEDLAVVEQLMTEDDKKKFSSAKDMVAPDQT